MKQVILLGSGPSHVSCPYDAEVWATSSLLPHLSEEQIKKISKVFSIDGYNTMKEGLDIATAHGIPIVSCLSYATEDFPFAEICKEFRTAYLKITVSYMLAYAIYLKYEKLRLYGIDAGPEWVYLSRKPYVTFWLGVATGRGIWWEVTRDSLLFRAMKEHIRKEYEKLGDKHDFISIARAGRDPYCFVDGLDPSAISVTTTGNKETLEWRCDKDSPDFVPLVGIDAKRANWERIEHSDDPGEQKMAKARHKQIKTIRTKADEER